MKPKTAALYARFSSDLQKDRSVDDQFAVCETYATREGFAVTHRFSDRAKSGASLFGRDGVIDLMLAAKERKFEVIIVENFERLSRDTEDLAGLFKRMKFAEVALYSVADGAADNMKVSLRGLLGSEYLKTLASQVKRGHNGRVREGKFPGAVTYGYDRVLGKPGERVINPETAEVVRRIFKEYAYGISPREIASALTRDNIPTPTGGSDWNHQTFVGGGEKNGLIGNRLYIGEIVWNKNHTVKDPDTGAASIRRTPIEQRIVTSVPHLRIIDQKLWDAAQAIREGRSVAKFGLGGMKTRAVVARDQHLLSGLLRCGQCMGKMIITNKARGSQFVTCAAAHMRSACQHRKSYNIDRLKDDVLDDMRDSLPDLEFIKERAKAAALEYARIQKETNNERLVVEKQYNKVIVQRDRIVLAISDSEDPVPALMDALKAKETERLGLEERLRHVNSASNVITLHPDIVTNYRHTVESMHHALMIDPDKPENRVAFRTLVDHIVVYATAYRAPYRFSTYGRLSAIMGVRLFPTTRSNKEILAEEGVSCPDIGNQDFSGLALSQQRNGLILLGRWRAAA